MVLRKVLTGSGAVLVLFHVWLLGGQIWAGELADSGRLLRWVAAFAVVGVLIFLYRRGQSLFRGRRALALWLLAAMLHGPSVADRIGTPGVPALPDVASALVQLAVASAAAVGLRLLAAFGRARQQRPSLRSAIHIIGGTLVGPLSPDAFLRLTPRPPPSA